MRGEHEARELIAVLEELLAALAAGRAGDSRLRRIDERYRAAVSAVREALGAEEELAEEERQALDPLLADVARLNALATSRARGESERVSKELGKVRRLAVARRRNGGDVGRSCDVSG